MKKNIASFELSKILKEKENNRDPIRVGLIGCGSMGTSILSQIIHMNGINLNIVVSNNPSDVLRSSEIAWQEKGHAQEVENSFSMNRTIENGLIAATNDLNLMLQNDQIDVVIDATGNPEAGAQFGIKVLEHNKHLVMMSVETDVTIGRYLKHEADKRGLIYTLGAGDEPSSCMELIEFISAMGYRIITAGKGKNNPMIPDAIPDDYQEESKKRNMNVRMLVEFIDGSKTMIEMASLSNATGLIPDCSGMHGPNTDLDKLHKILIPKKDGGILKKNGVVDYSTGKNVSPGVFVIAEILHPCIQNHLKDLKIGEGSYFTFYRPYHLTAMEVPLTCARVAIYGKPDMVPLKDPVSEVCAVAKKDLYPGDKLDFIGLYTYRAWIMTFENARLFNAIPCGLLANATVIKKIIKGSLITTKNTKINSETEIAKIRSKQDKLLN